MTVYYYQLKPLEYTEGKVPVRHGEVEDDTGRAKFSMWRQAALLPLQLNSILTITDVQCVVNKGSNGKMCINVNFPDEIKVNIAISFT